MSEIRYCYTCHRAQVVEEVTHREGWRICSVCKNDGLGETVAPELRPLPQPPGSFKVWWCDICNGAVDTKVPPAGDRVCMCARCWGAVEERPMSENAKDYRTRIVRPAVKGAAESAPTPPTFGDIAAKVAAIVERKNKAYGDSFGNVTRVLEIMFPHGIPVEAYADLGGIFRTLDKLFRVATDRDALEENLWSDIAGYSLLAVRRVEQDKGRA